LGFGISYAAVNVSHAVMDATAAAASPKAVSKKASEPPPAALKPTQPAGVKKPRRRVKKSRASSSDDKAGARAVSATRRRSREPSRKANDAAAEMPSADESGDTTDGDTTDKEPATRASAADAAPKSRPKVTRSSAGINNDEDGDDDKDSVTSMVVAEAKECKQPRRTSPSPPPRPTDSRLKHRPSASPPKAPPLTARVTPRFGEQLLLLQLNKPDDAPANVRIDSSKISMDPNDAVHMDANAQVATCTTGGALYWNLVDLVRDSGANSALKICFATLTRKDMHARSQKRFVVAPDALFIVNHLKRNAARFSSALVESDAMARISNEKLMWRLYCAHTNSTVVGALSGEQITDPQRNLPFSSIAVHGHVYVAYSVRAPSDTSQVAPCHILERFTGSLQNMMEDALDIAQSRTGKQKDTSSSARADCATNMMHTPIPVTKDDAHDGAEVYELPRIGAPQLFDCSVYDAENQMLQARCFVYALCPEMAVVLVRRAIHNGNYTNIAHKRADIVVMCAQTTDCRSGFACSFAPCGVLTRRFGASNTNTFWHGEYDDSALLASRAARLQSTAYGLAPHTALQWYHDLAWF
jgi:hypothetical protein